MHKTVVAAILPLSSLFQETALECHFGTDRTFEARWVNSSAVECIHVLVSEATSPCSPRGVGQGGSCPQPPTQRLGCRLPSSPPSPPAEKKCKPGLPLQQEAVCVGWCWQGIGELPMLRCLLRGHLQWLQPLLRWAWEGAACLPL